ncbi:MAG: hypothetical protein ACYCUE_09110 [Steroidobacteraceae bacterium]
MAAEMTMGETLLGAPAAITGAAVVVAHSSAINTWDAVARRRRE